MKELKNYSDYFVDENGNVYSSKSGTIKKLKPKIKRGWYYVRLRSDITHKPVFVGIHRLVAETFIPNDDPTKEVNHKNKIRNDNRVENLEWLTHADNVRFSRCKGLRVYHDDGRVIEYEGIIDFCKEYPSWNHSNIKKYIKLYNGYSKKNKIRFEYIE